MPGEDDAGAWKSVKGKLPAARTRASICSAGKVRIVALFWKPTVTRIETFYWTLPENFIKFAERKSQAAEFSVLPPGGLCFTDVTARKCTAILALVGFPIFPGLGKERRWKSAASWQPKSSHAVGPRCVSRSGIRPTPDPRA